MSTMKQIPEGYMQNGQGHLIPVSTIGQIDLERDTLVKELFAKAEEMADLVTGFKATIMGEIAAFVDLSLEQYGVRRGGKKGNICLSSYDQSLRIRLDICEEIQFTELLIAARELIDECLFDWTDGAKEQLKALINHVFEVDKAGNISATKVLGLRRYKIDDPRWNRAMMIIGQSVEIASTKPRLSFQRRGPGGAWETLSLNVSTAAAGRRS